MVRSKRSLRFLFFLLAHQLGHVIVPVVVEHLNEVFVAALGRITK